jgi:hypothetical protein
VAVKILVPISSTNSQEGGGNDAGFMDFALMVRPADRAWRNAALVGYAREARGAPQGLIWFWLLEMKSTDELLRVPVPAVGANKEFVDALVRAGARFLIVGSVAVKFYVAERSVEDLDLLIEPSKENASKILMAASSSPLFRRDITVKKLMQPKGQICVKIFQYYMDILTPAPDLDFVEAWNMAAEARIGNTRVRVAAIATLLQLLALSQRPQHVRDRELLGDC